MGTKRGLVKTVKDLFVFDLLFTVCIISVLCIHLPRYRPERCKNNQRFCRSNVRDLRDVDSSYCMTSYLWRRFEIRVYRVVVSR